MREIVRGHVIGCRLARRRAARQRSRRQVVSLGSLHEQRVGVALYERVRVPDWRRDAAARECALDPRAEAVLGLHDGVVEDAPVHRAPVVDDDLRDVFLSRRRARRARAEHRLGGPLVVFIGTLGTPLGTHIGTHIGTPTALVRRRRAVRSSRRHLVERPLLEPLGPARRRDADDSFHRFNRGRRRVDVIHSWHRVDVKVGTQRRHRLGPRHVRRVPPRDERGRVLGVEAQVHAVHSR